MAVLRRSSRSLSQNPRRGLKRRLRRSLQSQECQRFQLLLTRPCLRRGFMDEKSTRMQIASGADGGECAPPEFLKRSDSAAGSARRPVERAASHLVSPASMGRGASATPPSWPDAATHDADGSQPPRRTLLHQQPRATPSCSMHSNAVIGAVERVGPSVAHIETKPAGSAAQHRRGRGLSRRGQTDQHHVEDRPR